MVEAVFGGIVTQLTLQESLFQQFLFVELNDGIEPCLEWFPAGFGNNQWQPHWRKVHQGRAYTCSFASFRQPHVRVKTFFIDDNARPYRSSAVKAYLEDLFLGQQEVHISTL